MKQVSRCVPELALKKLNESIVKDPPLFKYEKEAFYFLLDLFYRIPAFNKQVRRTPDGSITISSLHLRAYITNGYAKHINWLVKHQIILCDRIKKTNKAYGYQLPKELESKIIRINIPGDTVIAKRIIENYNKRKKYHGKLPEHVKKMKNHFKHNMKVNLHAGLSWLENKLKEKQITENQYNVYLISLYAIEEKELFFKINDKNGRLDSNLTNLKSELRQFIVGDFQHIDCQNSQPLIVNFITDFISKSDSFHIPGTTPQPIYPSLGDESFKILKKELNNNELEYLKFFPKFNSKTLKEFIKYRSDTFEGDFYLAMQEHYEKLYGKHIDRKSIKQIIYKVFFSKNWQYREEKKVFKAMYPAIYSLIYNLKKEKHNRFALCLQRFESEIFIQRISKKLVEADIMPFTIHDSIIVIEKDQARTKEIMESVYQEFLQQSPTFICEKL